MQHGHHLVFESLHCHERSGFLMHCNGLPQDCFKSVPCVLHDWKTDLTLNNFLTSIHTDIHSYIHTLSKQLWLALFHLLFQVIASASSAAHHFTFSRTNTFCYTQSNNTLPAPVLTHLEVCLKKSHHTITHFSTRQKDSSQHWSRRHQKPLCAEIDFSTT